MVLSRSLALTLVFLAIGFPLRGAYAPIPEVERGKLLTAYISAGAYYDTNIFGAPDQETASWVTQLIPQLALNYNPDPQTLLALGYRAEWTHFTNRPGNADLFGHLVTARAARTFSPRWDGEINAAFGIVRNPESLLPGVERLLTRDQSRRDFESDGRVRYVLTPRQGLTFRGKAARFSYEQRGLADDLDRMEFLTATAWSYFALPRLQLIGEHRGQWVRYRVGGDFKDKDAHLLLAGADYSLGRRFGLTTRVGGEWRRRDEGVATRPYGELGLRYDYAKRSFVSAGYAYVIDEISNLRRYNDASLHRVFINAQHAVTANFLVSLSLLLEPTTLNGRRGFGGDVSETNRRAGVALTYEFSRRWDVRTTFDYDHVTSGDSVRNLTRSRSGVTMRYAF